MSRTLRLLVLIGFAFGCGDDPAHSLRVEVRTDLVATIEFDQFVITGESGESLSVPTSSVDFGTDWTSPRLMGDVATSAGTRRFRAELRLGENTVVGRDLHVSVEGRTGLSLVLTRDCSDVMCGADEACLAGQCVTQGCLSGLESECAFAPECTDDVECVASVACAPLACESPGFCFPRSFDCEANEYCDPVLDCQPLPGFEPDAGFDGGTTDSGVDAGVDAGSVVSPDAGVDAGVDAGIPDSSVDAGPVEPVPFIVSIAGDTLARDLSLAQRGSESCLAYEADGTTNLHIGADLSHTSVTGIPRMELVCLSHPSPSIPPTLAWHNFAPRVPLAPLRLACGATVCGLAAQVAEAAPGFTLVRADHTTGIPINLFRNRLDPLRDLGATDTDVLLFSFFDDDTDELWLRSLSGGSDAGRASYGTTGGTLGAFASNGGSVFMAGTWLPGATLPAGARTPAGLTLVETQDRSGIIVQWATAFDGTYDSALFATSADARPLASAFASDPHVALLAELPASTMVIPPSGSGAPWTSALRAIWIIGVDPSGGLVSAIPIVTIPDAIADVAGSIAFIDGADPHLRVAVTMDTRVVFIRVEVAPLAFGSGQGSLTSRSIDDVLFLDADRTLVAGELSSDQFHVESGVDNGLVDVRPGSAAFVYQHIAMGPGG